MRPGDMFEGATIMGHHWPPVLTAARSQIARHRAGIHFVPAVLNSRRVSEEEMARHGPVRTDFDLDIARVPVHTMPPTSWQVCAEREALVDAATPAASSGGSSSSVRRAAS